MQASQMTSVGIVGARRIGKSSLLYHIYQTYPQKLHSPERFLVAYASLQDSRVSTQTGFLNFIGTQFSRSLAAHPRAANLPPWPTPCQDMADFRTALDALTAFDAPTAQSLRPVLCLDEFEALFNHTDQFDDAFYDALRAAIDDQSLMLIVCSAHSLAYYGSRHRLVSRFFNLFATLNLGDFTESEAEALLLQPATPGGQPALGLTDRKLAADLGKHHPFFLQMAAHYVYEAQTRGHDEDWVRRQFAAQAKDHKGLRQTLRNLRDRLLAGPATLGRLAGRIGSTWDTISNTALGIVIIIAIVVIPILALLGLANAREIIAALLAALGLSGGN